jgi:hypothetical protein
MAAEPPASNPNSWKRITVLVLGEAVCDDHGGDLRVPITPTMGICYACAVAAGEPVREDLR